MRVLLLVYYQQNASFLILTATPSFQMAKGLSIIINSWLCWNLFTWLNSCNAEEVSIFVHQTNTISKKVLLSTKPTQSAKGSTRGTAPTPRGPSWAPVAREDLVGRPLLLLLCCCFYYCCCCCFCCCYAAASSAVLLVFFRESWSLLKIIQLESLSRDHGTDLGDKTTTTTTAVHHPPTHTSWRHSQTSCCGSSLRHVHYIVYILFYIITSSSFCFLYFVYSSYSIFLWGS